MLMFIDYTWNGKLAIWNKQNIPSRHHPNQFHGCSIKHQIHLKI